MYMFGFSNIWIPCEKGMHCDDPRTNYELNVQCFPTYFMKQIQGLNCLFINSPRYKNLVVQYTAL